jgi:hypothetical protein
MWSAQHRLQMPAMLGQQNPQGRRWGLGMAHFEDYELAQKHSFELLELRARANSATSVELNVIAAKAELESRATVDDARTNAWLAICRLASETANNETAAEENAPNRMIDTDPLWAIAIDRAQAWVTEAA